MQEVIDWISALRGMPEWSRSAIESRLGIALERDKTAKAKVKVYRGAVNEGPFEAVRLVLPIFGGHLGFTVHVGVSKAAAISRVDLGGLVPPHAKGTMNAVAIGAKTPPPMTYTLDARDPSGDASFSFEQAHGTGVTHLYGIQLKRPHPGNDAAFYDGSQFRAYSVEHEGAPSYVIDRIATQTEAIRVPDVRLQGRELAVSYVASETMIGEPLARVLIRRRLIDELLAPEFAGKYDRIAYTSVELESTVVVKASQAGA